MKTIEFNGLTFTVPQDTYKLVVITEWIIRGYTKLDSHVWSVTFMDGHGIPEGLAKTYLTPEEDFQEEIAKLHKNQWRTRQVNYFGLYLNIPIDHEWVATDKNGTIYSYACEPEPEEDKFTCSGVIDFILDLPVDGPLVNWEHSIKHFPEDYPE